MSLPGETVVGIDVGGEKKGFHAVAKRGGVFEVFSCTDPAKIAKWCLEQNATVVAVDAPSGWSQDRKSRKAERDLWMGNVKIHCFSTPTRKEAVRKDVDGKNFYGWVFNGEKLYKCLSQEYPLFDGKHRKGSVCLETFPHAIVCALRGRVVPAKPKLSTRRKVLRENGYDCRPLSNIDFVDAALCAVTAEVFRHG